MDHKHIIDGTDARLLEEFTTAAESMAKRVTRIKIKVIFMLHIHPGFTVPFLPREFPGKF